MTLVEFRVRWQRDGRSISRRLYQTEAAARRKIDALLALEEVKGDTRYWEDMPDLVGPPKLEVREVTAWRGADPAPRAAPSAEAVKDVAAWASSWDQDEEIY